MKSIQKKFFQELEDHLDDKATGELVVQEKWANTGTGFIQRHGTFHNLSVFEYSFQDDYASFNINGRPYLAYYYQPKDNWIDLEEIIGLILSPVPDPNPLTSLRT